MNKERKMKTYVYIMISGNNVYVERLKRKDLDRYKCSDVVIEDGKVVKNRFNINEDKLLQIANATDISDIEITQEVKIEPITWEEFRKQGMLWWINRILHLFGYAICLEYEDGKIKGAFPCRTNYRGFSPIDESAGFHKLTKFLNKSVEDLVNDFDCDDKGGER